MTKPMHLHERDIYLIQSGQLLEGLLLHRQEAIHAARTMLHNLADAATAAELYTICNAFFNEANKECAVLDRRDGVR